jgi:HEAT repeat protein
LGVFRAPAAIDLLMQALQDKEAHVRFAAVQALGKIGAARAIEPLWEIFKNPDEAAMIREKAFEALKALGVSNADALFSDEWTVRRDAVAALAANDAEHSVPVLKKMVDDASKHVRIATITALGKFHDARSLPALTARLKEEKDLEVRQAAVAALGEIGDETALEYLDQLVVEDKNLFKKIISPWNRRQEYSLKESVLKAKEKIKTKQTSQNGAKNDSQQ